MLSKTAVECLLDWYLDSTHVGFTLRAHAGTEEKLEALDAEGYLAIGTSLFRDVLFEPRNRAIHSYEAVNPKSARHAYELARLFVRNAQLAHAPDECSIYYGGLEIARGVEARRLSGHDARKASVSRKRINATYFYFGGIGAAGEHGVLLARKPEPTIAVLESLGDGLIDVRYAPLRQFPTALLRETLAMLETNKPDRHDLEVQEIEQIVDRLSRTLTEKCERS